MHSYEPVTICLNMIVKNEAPVIAQCLRSVIPLISYWVIVDTGSNDDTMVIIRETLNGVPGELHQRPWKNFGHNRSEAIALASGKSQYILTIDADETLVLAEGFSPQHLTGDAYYIEKSRENRCYSVLSLVRDGLEWKWEGVLHEYLTSEYAADPVRLDHIAILSPRQGGRSRDPKLFQRDALILEQALLEDPTDSRNVFYLAQSYRDAGDLDLAIRNYQRRAGMGGWAEEVFLSLYQIARLKVQRGDPWTDCMAAYLKAWNHTPQRAEPLYDIGMHFSERGDWPCAWLFLEKAASIRQDASLILFIEQDIYDWRAKLEAAVAAYYVGEHSKAVALNAELLACTALPERLSENVLRNISLSQQALGELSAVQA